MSATFKFIKKIQNNLGLANILTSLVNTNQDGIIDDLLTLVMNMPAYITKPFKMNHIYTINMDSLDSIDLISGVFIPGKLMISASPSLTFIMNPVVTYDKRKRIKVIDRKIVTDPLNLSYEIQVCNNALDEVPTWETMSTEYSYGLFYGFTNNIKTTSNWAIGVKIIITKLQPSAEVEFTDLYVAHM